MAHASNPSSRFEAAVSRDGDKPFEALTLEPLGERMSRTRTHRPIPN